MKRYDTINIFKACKVIDVDEPVDEIGPYLVDDSNFCPMSEAIRQLSNNALSDSTINQFYDFANGQDTGIKVPITRTKNGKDIAEISSSIMDQVNDISDNIIKKQEAEQKQKAFEQSLKTSINTTLSSTQKTE